MVDIPSGSVSDPGLKFVTEPSGLFLHSVNDVRLGVNGRAVISFRTNSISMSPLVIHNAYRPSIHCFWQ